jgi:hypothetical protein
MGKALDLLQASMAAGEIAPELYGRTDLAKYHIALKACRNFIIRPAGGAHNRPGTEFVGRVRYSGKLCRLIEFQFNNDQTYALEFSDLCMRVVMNGAHVTEATKAITGVSTGNPVQLTIVGHGYSASDDIYIDGIAGPTTLNGQRYLINVINPDTVELIGVDGSVLPAYINGGTAARIYTMVTPYAEAHLQKLKFTQSADTLTIFHPLYRPQDITRAGHANWSITPRTFRPTVPQPSGAALTINTAGTVKVRYKVTAVDVDGTEESLTAISATSVAISGITNAIPAVVTTGVAHNLTSGDDVQVDSIGSLPLINGGQYIVNVLTATTFELRNLDNTPVDTTSMPIYGGGGAVYQLFVRGLTATMSTTNWIDVSWTTVAGGKLYNVYKEKNGIFGFIGSAALPPFRDDGISPATDDAAPQFRDPFANDNFPSCGDYFEQRMIYANTNKKTNGYWASQSANYKNMNVSQPTADSDAFTRALVAKKVQDIRHMVSMNVLIMFTGSAVWKVWSGANNDVLTPKSATARLQEGSVGAADVPPIPIGSNIIFVQAAGNCVYDLAYDLTNDVYKGSDISLLSNHLLEGRTIKEWAFQQNPNRVVWAVLTDGTLAGLTYQKDQEVYAWHRHDTDGFFESVCAIEEGRETAVYFIVRRVINGQTYRYIERLHTRVFATIGDAWFSDCALSYSGVEKSVISGYGHLEGKTVNILADGSVQPQAVVTNGTITLQRAASKVIAGLPIQADLVTLAIDIPGGDTVGAKRKKVSAVNLRVAKTRGLKIGPVEEDGSIRAERLIEFKDRSFDDPMGSPITPKTRKIRQQIDNLWNDDGSIIIRQDYPLPASILSIIPELTIA